MMLQLGGSNTQVALVQASVTLPILFLALFAGALADNYSRRSVMLFCQFAMFIASVALCITAWLGLLTPWILLGFTFTIGCGLAINAPSWQANVGDIVPRDTIASAVAMNSLGFNIARSVGPALGGMIVAAAGAAAAFTFNALSYVALIGVLLTWKQKKEPPRLKESLGAAMAAGVRYVAMSPPVRTVLGRALLVGLAASAVPSLLPLVAHDLLGGEATTFGFLSGGFGAGAVIGALSTRHVRARLSSEAIIRLALTSLILGAVIISQSRHLPLSIFGLIFVRAGWILSIATMNVTVQMSVPRWVVGRALSLFQMFVFGSMAFGSFAAGRLSEQLGVANTILIMAAVQSISLFAGLVLRLPNTDDENLDPAKRWKVPNVKLDISPRSGPVHVTIRFEINQADLDEFLSVMKERRRIRMRDGARNWTLTRDLQEPDIWIEHYRFSRWRDYVLHNERQTIADVPSLARVRQLHRGTNPPEVHRTLERPLNAHITDPDVVNEITIDPARGS